MEERQTLGQGTIVYSADGEQLGTIRSSDTSSFVVEAGVLPPDIHVPLSAIVLSRDGEVHLSVTKADALDQRWTQSSAPQVLPDQVVEPGTDYTAVQGEDSLEEDPMPAPGAQTSPDRPSVSGDDLERPSGITGPDTTA